MHLVVDVVGGGLQLLEERVEECEEGVDGREARDGGVSREVDHCLVDVLVRDVLSGWLVVLLLIDTVELLPDLSTDGVLRVVSALYSFKRVLEDPQEGCHAFPGVVDHLSIGIGHSRP